MLCGPSHRCVNLTSSNFSDPSPICMTRKRTCHQWREVRQRISIRCEASKSSSQPKPLVIVGSLNADSVLEVERLPEPGETMSAKTMTTFPGGKVSSRQATERRKLPVAQPSLITDSV